MKGYRRSDGRFGIRNHVLILSTVGCANMMVRKIAAQVPGAVALENSKGWWVLAARLCAAVCSTLRSILMSMAH